ncbi:MAG: RluA family pseudouridine synthase [Trueperaceae bacterium]
MKLNQGYSYQEQLNVKARGQMLLEYLVKSYEHSTRETWQERIDQGEVLLNNVVTCGDKMLQPGQTLIWNRPPWYEEDTPQHYDVIFQDETLLVVNKPSDLPTVPAGGFLENTLFSLVRKNFPTAQSVHRLGRGTSGLVLFALTTEANKALSKLWREHKVEKYYKALASGVAQQDVYDIRAAIGLVEHPKLGYVYAASEKGKPSVSDARVLERASTSSANSDATLFEIKLLTGRPHQIRIHLAFIGHPLVGDPLYTVGGKFLDTPGLPGEGGYFLHAEKLVFVHPVTGERLELVVPAPVLLG